MCFMNYCKNDKQDTVICFVAGGSGGHIIPGLTYAQKFFEVTGARIIFMTTKKELDCQLLRPYKWIHHVPLSIRAFPGLHIMLIPWMYYFIKSFFESLSALKRYKVTHIKSMGALLSLPVWLASRLLRISYEVYEFNIIPGKAVNFLAKRGVPLYACFEETKKHLPSSALVFVTQYPIRFRDDEVVSSKRARSLLKLDQNKRILFIVGGSQGSQGLNDLIERWLGQQKMKNINNIFIIHQSGQRDCERMRMLYAHYKVAAIVSPYIERIALVYQASNAVISRCGAGALSELEFFKKTAALIPLKTSYTSHQLDNGAWYASHYPDRYMLFDQDIVHSDPQPFFNWIECVLS